MAELPPEVDLPEDPSKAFAALVGMCATAYGRELMDREGITDTQARNVVIQAFLDMAAGEACRIARGEDREPDPEKWRKATSAAFEKAVERTAKADSPKRGGEGDG